MRLDPVQFHDHDPARESLREAVVTGLDARPKTIPPKFFYDRRGSQLFEQICDLPEYYLTRTEIAILHACARDIARRIGDGCLLVELGSGASTKVRILLEALQPAAYLGIDISRDFLLQATRRLAHDYPWLEVHAAWADFTHKLELAWCPTELRKLAFFPGSSIGNFDPDEARRLLAQLRPLLAPDGALVIGVDLKKAPDVLHAAYNDPQGITAAFNLNLLHRIRRELDTDLRLDRFLHRAFYDATRGRIEMHLVSRVAQQVRVDGHRFPFVAGESIHTENSYKYSIEEFQRLAQTAGYRPEQVWTDPRQLFSVHYLSVA